LFKIFEVFHEIQKIAYANYANFIKNDMKISEYTILNQTDQFDIGIQTED